MRPLAATDGAHVASGGRNPLALLACSSQSPRDAGLFRRRRSCPADRRCPRDDCSKGLNRLATWRHRTKFAAVGSPSGQRHMDSRNSIRLRAPTWEQPVLVDARRRREKRPGRISQGDIAITGALCARAAGCCARGAFAAQGAER